MKALSRHYLLKASLPAPEPEGATSRRGRR